MTTKNPTIVRSKVLQLEDQPGPSAPELEQIEAGVFTDPVPVLDEPAPGVPVEQAKTLRERVRNHVSTVEAISTGHIPAGSMDQARLRVFGAQLALLALGYGSTPAEGDLRANGIWSPGTRDRLSVFQEERGLPVTGQLDDQTFETLLGDCDVLRAGVEI